MKKFKIIFVFIIILFNTNFSYAQTSYDYNLESNEDKTIFNEDLIIDEKMNKNINIFNGNVEINNTVNGDISSFFSKVTINSKVNGNIVSFFGEVDIGENGEVKGDVINFFEGENSFISKFEINNEKNLVLPDIDEGEFFKFKLITLIVLSIITFVFCMLFILIFKNWLYNITSDIEYEFPKKLGVGFLIYLAVLIILLLTFYLIIPLIIWFVLIIVLNVLFMLFVGRIVVKIASVDYNIYIEFIIGFFVMLAVKVGVLVLLPAGSILMYFLVSFSIDIIVKSIGFGVLVIGIRSKDELRKTIK